METKIVTTEKAVLNTTSDVVKPSALSISSIQKKKDLIETSQGATHNQIVTENNPFSANDMLLVWNKYAAKLDEKGKKIISSILQLTDPKLEGNCIIIELPNQTTFSTFESEKATLLGYLKSKLQNHSITIEVIINEEVASKNAYTDSDKFIRLKEINPALELLQKTFDLYY